MAYAIMFRVYANDVLREVPMVPLLPSLKFKLLIQERADDKHILFFCLSFNAD